MKKQTGGCGEATKELLGILLTAYQKAMAERIASRKNNPSRGGFLGHGDRIATEYQPKKPWEKVAESESGRGLGWKA